jgi:hypothetical protein
METTGLGDLDLSWDFACSVQSAVHGVRYPFVSFEGPCCHFQSCVQRVELGFLHSMGSAGA